MRQKFLLFIVLCSTFFFFTEKGSASEIDSYRVDYTADLFPLKNRDTQVEMTIKITTVRSDILIRQFGLNFPQNFKIKNIQMLTSDTPAPAVSNGEQVNVLFEIPQALQGKDKEITLKLRYLQENLYKKNGSVYEFIIPAVSSKKNSRFTVFLHVPEFIKNKVAIAKPVPSKIEGSVVEWSGVSAQAIYAVFGDSQAYKLDLHYHLQNSSFSRRQMDIALPPETLYQKIFVESIDPVPQKTYVDLDGNYMARFILNPRSRKTINFRGIAEVLAKPQKSFMPYIHQNFSDQKNVLIAKKPYWNLGDVVNEDVVKNLISVDEVYNAVVATLDYRYEKIEDRDRLGAQKALKDRSNAVCTEYADLFVALSRNKKIPSREIEGYGFSSDSRLRPLSLASDVLHAWAEYYDENAALWIPVDPTWHDTSKIDYFSAFDLNHIVFAIHGADDSRPAAAGMYKIENTKDISVIPIDTVPSEKDAADIKTTIPSTIMYGKVYKAKLTIENRGAVFIKDKKIELKSSQVQFSPSSFPVLLLAPLEKKEFSFTYSAKEKSVSDQISIYLDDEPLDKKPVAIKSSGADLFTTAVGLTIGLVIAAILLFLKFKNSK